ncbi:MAG: ABC transporter substrate-binding protein [Nitriliruptor sp.]|uniref:ABC transporter substrate-binding protein n=1 Tax=Nitriliruptor sp. TaxID=2448056 RepID=UPI0034A07B01
MPHRIRAVVPLLLVALTATACSFTAAPGSDGAEGAEVDPSEWNDVVAAADGATLDLHMWGGSTEINRFVDEVYGPRLAELGITLSRVPLADTADAVNAVLGELEAGRSSGGSVDLIWINGDNFATMRQAEALLIGWAEELPNAELVDWDDPAVAFDAGLAVEGAESPWGSAQFQFVHDTARTGETHLPRSYAELADWIVANPGRFTYPAPPAFHGTRFLKQWFYELSGGPDAWVGSFDEDAYAEAAAPLWALLDDLRPHLWRGGETYPGDIADLDQLFANGEVDLTFTLLPAGIGANIDAGTLPATARPFVFDTGTIADHHYLAIPVNAGDPAAAMVFADLVLDPDLQAAKLDPAGGWGDGLAIASDRVDAAQAAAVGDIVDDLGETAVDQERLAAVRLPDSLGALTRALDQDWDRFIRQRQPRS